MGKITAKTGNQMNMMIVIKINSLIFAKNIIETYDGYYH